MFTSTGTGAGAGASVAGPNTSNTKEVDLAKTSVKARTMPHVVMVEEGPNTSNVKEVVVSREQTSESCAGGGRSLEDLANTSGISGLLAPCLRRLLTMDLLLTRNEESGHIEVESIPSTTTTTTVLAEKDLLPEWAQVKNFVGKFLEQLVHAELISINDVSCRGRPLYRIQEQLIALEGTVTLVFQKVGQEDPWTMRMVFSKPVAEPSSDYDDAEVPDLERSRTFSNDSSPLTLSPNEADKGLVEVEAKESCRKEDTENALVEPQGSTNAPLVERGRILSIVGTAFWKEFDATEVERFIANIDACLCISIYATELPSRREPKASSWRQNLKKGLITVGGGTMVGAGTILMVTPLHPIGHAMALGGVGVLATEYEKPKKMAKNASKSFSNLVNRFRQCKKCHGSASMSDSGEVENQHPY